MGKRKKGALAGGAMGAALAAAAARMTRPGMMQDLKGGNLKYFFGQAPDSVAGLETKRLNTYGTQNEQELNTAANTEYKDYQTAAQNKMEQEREQARLTAQGAQFGQAPDSVAGLETKRLNTYGTQNEQELNTAANTEYKDYQTAAQNKMEQEREQARLTAQGAQAEKDMGASMQAEQTAREEADRIQAVRDLRQKLEQAKKNEQYQAELAEKADPSLGKQIKDTAKDIGGIAAAAGSGVKDLAVGTKNVLADTGKAIGTGVGEVSGKVVGALTPSLKADAPEAALPLTEAQKAVHKRKAAERELEQYMKKKR
jgi:hypothetical protein